MNLAKTFDSQDWIIEATIYDIQRRLTSGQISSVELVQLYFQRIARFDHGKINSVLEINPDALHIAEALDYERKVKGPRGPLHGIPILLKDNIDTKDKMHTSAGSLSLANHYASEDAFVVSQLRKSGAILLGKVNMTEFANFMTENMTNGYSSRGGQVLNPYGASFDVGGSSSGSGASIASNFAVAAIGTETSGSILSPASNNSLVGVKPTVGLVSRTGIIPISFSQDTAGPMARTVTDAAILLGAMTGVDENDPITKTSEEEGYTDYTQFLEETGLRGTRIGIPRGEYWKELSEEEIALMEAAITTLQNQGAIIIDNIPLPEGNEWDYNVLIYEFKPALNAYLRSVKPTLPVRSLADVIAFNLKDPEKMLRFGQTLLEKSDATSGSLTEQEYINSLLHNHEVARKGIDQVLKDDQLDAILFPSYFGCDIAARAGYPSITVPAGYCSNNQPFGITFTGKAFSEPVLFSLSYAYEQATLVRKPPILE